MDSTDISRLIDLVESLYKPNNDPQAIRSAQFKLQRIQKSPDGWELANRLLESPSPNCQFFGALTFTVKLNGINADHPDIDPDQILHQLGYWLAAVKTRQFKPFVVTKLLSTLSTFLIKFPSHWSDSVLSVISIIATGESVVKFDKNINANHITSQLLLQLSAKDLILVLKFCKTLIDDYRSTYLPDAKNAEVQAILLNNLNYFIQLVNVTFDGLANAGGFQSNDNTMIDLLTQTLETTASWINHFSKNTQAERELKPFIPYFLDYLETSSAIHDEAVFLLTSEHVTEMFKYNKNIWDRSARERLYQFILKTGSVIVPQLQQYQGQNDENEHDGPDDRNVSFCRLLITFAEYLTPVFLEDPEDESSYSLKTLVEYIIAFSNLSAIPIVEDSMAMEVLEFWSNFVEEIVGGGTLSSDQPQTAYVSRIIGIYWHRIMLPPESITLSWSKDTWQEFLTFRRDFCDFLELAYPIVSTALFNLLVSSVMENIKASEQNIIPPEFQRDLSKMDWRQIECSLYCLNGLSEMIGTSGDEYSAVKSVFSSSLWEDLPSCNILRVRQTAVSLIGSFDSFFERPEGQPYLTATLSYLFKSLTVPNLALTASRSIQKLCTSSRQHLVSLLPNFLELYVSQQYYCTIGTIAHERTVNAIACVIQALGSLEDKAQYINKLVSILVEQLYLVIQRNSITTETEPQLMSTAVSLLKCLANIGKGLRVPEEISKVPKDQLQSIALFWESYGASTRQKVLQIIQAFTIDQTPFNADTQICEICCDIFKSGFSEIIINPFVFSPEIILTFISGKHKFGPPKCHSTLIGLALCLVSSSSVGYSALASNYISTLLEIFFTSAEEPSEYEPDTQVGNLRLLTQIFSHYPDSFLSSPPALEFMIGFASEMLGSNDRFVMRATSNFWTTFITKDHVNDDALRSRRVECLKSSGPIIVEKIIHKISGDAARSDLEYFSDIIKKLVSKYPMEAKPWFVQAVITSPRGALAQRDLNLRTRFVTKIFNVRGGRETNNVVKNFWSDCKGIANYT